MNLDLERPYLWLVQQGVSAAFIAIELLTSSWRNSKMFLQIIIEKSNCFDGWTHRLGVEATVTRDTWRQMIRTDEIINTLCAETIAAPRHIKGL